jgi:hypothetical protein
MADADNSRDRWRDVTAQVGVRCLEGQPARA